MPSIKFSELKSFAMRFGLEAVSYSASKNASSQIEYLKFWQSQGYSADLEYMQRDSELLCDPSKLFAELKSIVVFTISYSSSKRSDLKPGYGKVARYAWGRDYHNVIKKRMKAFLQALSLDLGLSFNYRYFADAVPLLERFYAKESGLGFIGKNTMLIRPKLGSFCFLSEILWDLEILEPPLPVVQYNCGSCSRCIDICPTEAIVEPFKLDARRCISYLTIEKKGVLSEWEQKALGEWLFGCDLCQEVCPFNYSSLKRQDQCWVEFSDLVAKDGQLSLVEVLSIPDDSTFLKRFAGSPLMRTKRQGLLRNACAVSLNLGFQELKPLVENLARNEQDLIIKQQAEQVLGSWK